MTDAPETCAPDRLEPGVPGLDGGPLPPFDAASLEPHTLDSKGSLGARLLADPRWLFKLLRDWWPIPRLPFTRWHAVTRFDDVQEVLGDDDAFPAPFDDRIRALNGGGDFVLGMRRTPAYEVQLAQIMDAFGLERHAHAGPGGPPDDVDRVASFTARQAEAIVSAAAGRLDAVGGLLTLTATRVAREVFGIDVEDEAAFAEWTMAMSAFMFSGPFRTDAIEAAAEGGAARVNRLLQRSIERRRAEPEGRDDVCARLVRRQLGLGRAAPDADCTDAQIRAILSGMVTGFVPTDTMAAGHMLEVLLERPEAMQAARAAALADDDDRLRRCLFEAMRFKPLNPGPFRHCVKARTVAAGTWRAKRFRPGDQILAGTWPAMFDERRYTDPDAFDPDRPESQYMLYGYGLHWCIGAPFANAQITQSFKALLRAGRIRPAEGEAGHMRLLGPFPHRLVVEWTP